MTAVKRTRLLCLDDGGWQGSDARTGWLDARWSESGRLATTVN